MRARVEALPHSQEPRPGPTLVPVLTDVESLCGCDSPVPTVWRWASVTSDQNGLIRQMLSPLSQKRRESQGYLPCSNSPGPQGSGRLCDKTTSDGSVGTAGGERGETLRLGPAWLRGPGCPRGPSPCTPRPALPAQARAGCLGGRPHRTCARPGRPHTDPALRSELCDPPGSGVAAGCHSTEPRLGRAPAHAACPRVSELCLLQAPTAPEEGAQVTRRRSGPRPPLPTRRSRRAGRRPPDALFLRALGLTTSLPSVLVGA